MLKSKFTLGFFLLFIVVSSLCYYAYSSFRQVLVTDQIEINLAETRALEARISRWLERRKTEISTLANTPTIRSMDWAQSGPFLKQKHSSMPWFYIFAHINPDGTYYNSKVDFAEGQNLSDRAHFQASINGGVYASDPVVSRTLGTDIVAITSPIYRTDEMGADIIGVFGGMIDTSTIVEELARFSNGINSYAFAINSSGIAISHPDTERMGNINTKAVSLRNDADPGMSTVALKMLEGQEGWARVILDGQDAFVTFTPVNEASWYIATVTDASHVNSQLTALNIAAAFFALILLLTFYVVLRLRNSEAQRLEAEKIVVEEKNRAKSNFLANVSHELRTPLNAIIGYSDLLQTDRELPPAVQKNIRAINNSGRHLLSLINRILDLAKVEAGKLELDTKPTLVQSLVNDTVKSLEIAVQKYPTSFSTSIEVPTDLIALIDGDKLVQIINNITINAFKYGGAGHVTLAAYTRLTSNKSSILTINVVDQGIGMTNEEIETAFNEFEQIDTKSSGLGLGLAIVKQLVTLLHGNIEIASKVGEGTSVQVKIPLDHTDINSTSMYENQINGTLTVDGQGHSILIIDDNIENGELMKELLTRNGFNAKIAYDGADGFNYIQKFPFDLIITDLVMPKMNGFELLRSLKTNNSYSHIPVIVASASAFEKDKRASFDAGADAFLSKPVELNKVLLTVCQLLKIDAKEINEEIYRDEVKGQRNTYSNEKILVLDVIEQKKALEIISLAELGNFPEIRKILINTKSQGIQSLNLFIEEELINFDAEGVIKKIENVLRENER